MISQFIKLIRTIQYVEEYVTLKQNTLIGTIIINVIDVMKVLLLLIIVSDVPRMVRKLVVLNVRDLCSLMKKHTNANKLVVNSKEMISHAINVMKAIYCFMILKLVFLNVHQITLLMKKLVFAVKNVNLINMPDTMIKFV